MKQISIKKNIFYSTFYQVLSLITPLITAPYVSRVLGVDNIGVYSFTSSIVTYFTLFAALGTSSYGMREISRTRDDEQKRSELFWEIETVSIITSCVCIAAWGIFSLFQNKYKLIYIILTLNLVNSMLDISWLYDGLEQFKYTVAKNSAVKIAGVILIFLFVRSHDDLIKYVLIMTLSTLLGTATMWITLPRFVIRVKIRVENIKIHFHETLIYFIPTIATSVYTVLDKTLIGIITNDSYQNGYYEQATKVINMAKSISFSAVNSVLSARIAFLFAKNKTDEIKERILKSIDYILFAGVGLCFGIIGIADTFVVWYFGKGYEPVIFLLRLLSPIIIIIGISNCLGSHYYTPAGYRKQSACYIIAGSVTNLILNLLLIPKYQSAGAIVASLIAELLITFLYMKNCNGYLTIKNLLSKSWKKLVSGSIMAVIVYLMNGISSYNLTLCVLLQIASGIAVYVGLLAIMQDSFVTGYVKQQVKKILHKSKD